jgi:hypothetical protein
LWQVSQLADELAETDWYGMWVALRPSAGGYPPVWHEAHLAATVTCVWLNLLGVQPVVLWQLKQLVDPTGAWVDGLPLALEPSWQLAQLVEALKPEWSTLAADQLLVDLWQLSQLPVTLAWIALPGLPTAGRNAPVWQVAQAPVTVTLEWNLAGVQVEKPDLWQVSQLADALAETEV